MEVVEGFKEGYENDVLEPEMSVSATEDDNKKKDTEVSDEEEDNTKEEDNTNDSDEDFNIDTYVASNKDLLETTAESSSIRYVAFVCY